MACFEISRRNYLKCIVRELAFGCDRTFYSFRSASAVQSRFRCYCCCPRRPSKRLNLQHRSGVQNLRSERIILIMFHSQGEIGLELSSSPSRMKCYYLCHSKLKLPLFSYLCHKSWNIARRVSTRTLNYRFLIDIIFYLIRTRHRRHKRLGKFVSSFENGSVSS